jgi:DNA-binding NarL/FixJ family response regulator
VLIVDDHKVFTDALSHRLGAEDDLEVVDVARTGSDALQVIDLRRPDVVLLDVELGERDDGIELIREVEALRPETRVLVITAHDDPATATRALGAGARGFVPKDIASEDLVAAVRAVTAGETHIAPDLLTHVLTSLRSASSTPNVWQQKVDRLTEREREVLELMVGGLDRAAIADRLFLSINTVRTHSKNILAKLGVHSSLEAVSVALRAGMRPDSR